MRINFKNKLLNDIGIYWNGRIKIKTIGKSN